MRDLDETDLAILQALMGNARKPWAEIAETVDLSPPAVSDRVDRLQEMGIVRRFTVDIDRSKLREGVPVLVRVETPTAAVDDARASLREAEAVEHLFTTAERDLICYARIPDGDVPRWLDATLAADAVDDYTVTLLTEGEWTPTVGGTGFALSCAECGNTVTSEGTTARIGGERHQFCCPSCERRFAERYERFDEGAGDGAE
ncbi:AsnC family transcriptional regulator [Haloplanus rallus]|uniref:AsnC family transcriptional regulator n=1 Tax=Haloplanus rallus TaxID=1816183 RepID=A0A6B9F7L5_9EURY|nr:AsnC family transcriptional regulator [Haloplanus rallus]QGX96456.1 AsnC family transcriptional regulator [Haloplanus rallus]